jgi:hypothetical protein
MKNTLPLALILITLVGCSSRNEYRLDGFRAARQWHDHLDLIKREQRIRATCNLLESECAEALRAGNSADCYIHASDALPPDEYSARVDPYVGSGLVCHVRDGHSKILIMRTQTCVDTKKIDLMFVGG